MGDKIAHFIIGFVIGIMTFLCYYFITGNYKYAVLAAVTVGISAGAMKEFFDIGNGTVDIWDFLVTVQGSFFGAIIAGYKKKQRNIV